MKSYPADVKVVFKNFPLKNHRFSFEAATAALAAHRQGRFWEFHDRLFDDYNRLSSERIREIAAEEGLDMVKLAQDMKDPGITARIRQDLSDAYAAGVRGVPSVFINGRFLRDRSLDGFKALIEDELRKEKQ